MKLVIATGIYPPEIGGPAGYAKRLATALIERGHRVKIVTYGDDNTEGRQSTEYRARSTSEKSDGVSGGEGISSAVCLLPLVRVVVVKRSGRLVVRYAKYAHAVWNAALKADLVYLMGPVSEGLPGTIGAILAGKPTVLKVVGDYAWEQYQQGKKYEVRSSGDRPEDVLRTSYSVLELLDEFLTHCHTGKVRLFEKIERWVARRAKAIIVPSRYLKTVVTRWGIAEQKIKIIYNSVEALPEDAGEIRKSESPKYGKEGRKIILTAVRAVPWKGVDFLCDCLKELPAEFVLAVAGDGPYLEQWKKYAQEIGVANRVIWLGKLARKDLADWYRKADVFALATGYEGFPHVVVEACYLGLPCVVSDKGGNPETAEMFPGLVRVVEYRSKEKWVEAFEAIDIREIRKKEEGRRFDGLPDVLGFERMVNLTEEVLKKNV